MRTVRFEEMFPWEVAQAIAEAPICYLPLGVLEWHSEHSEVGLDGIKAQAVCKAAARRRTARCRVTRWPRRSPDRISMHGA
ncbi:MAG: creatininase family protein [Chloroflexia bacterium]|jgi:creatinine amidohydrolase/Fe(II)-dependent formamide hydrolase-like protein|nr:creatininase family protein [Chloroflexia bacterium]